MSDTDHIRAYTDASSRRTHVLTACVDTDLRLPPNDSDALPLALSTVISLYCTLKKQVLRFTSMYLMRAGYLFAFLFYPREVGPLQYLDIEYCSCFTVHYLHSFPAKSKSLFHFATEKLTTQVYFRPYLTMLFSRPKFPQLKTSFGNLYEKNTIFR